MIERTAVDRFVGAVTTVAPPVGFERLKLTVLVPSARVFCKMGTVKVFVRTLVGVPPGGKVSVPAVGR